MVVTGGALAPSHTDLLLSFCFFCSSPEAIRPSVSPRLSEPLMPLPFGSDDGGGRGLGLGNQLDGFVDGSDGVQGVGVGGGPEQDQGVGGVLLAQGPGPVVGGPQEPCGRGRLEAQGGRVLRLEEGEELGGQLEELVARSGGRVVEGDALVGVLD